MTTPNDDFIGRYKERQPISSRLKVDAGDYVSPFGRQRKNLVGEAKPFPDAIPACRPQKIKDRKKLELLTDDEVEGFGLHED